LEKGKKIRTAIIGLGKMGILHSALINMIPQAELVSLHDANKKLSSYVKSSGLNVAFYSDIDQMLESEALDAVFICTPPLDHLSLAQKCLAHDMDLFIEKPLAESFSSAKKIVSLLKDKQIIHSTGYVFAHIPLLRKAKEILDKNVIGEVFRFNASAYISQVFGKKKGWLFDKSKSGGGVIIDIGSHLIYLLVWFFGVPVNVFAKTMSFFSSVEDSGTIMMEYAGGMSGILDTNWSIPGCRQTAIELILEGENGLMEVTGNYLKLNLHRAVSGFDQGWTTLHKIDFDSPPQFDLGMEGFYNEDSHFIDCCLERKRPYVTWKEGLEVQRFIEAVYRSSESNRPVALDSIR
jgi:predicted dehydrogenase